jgi:hypothetical protein
MKNKKTLGIITLMLFSGLVFPFVARAGKLDNLAKVTCAFEPSEITDGESSSLSWSATNLTSLTLECTGPIPMDEAPVDFSGELKDIVFDKKSGSEKCVFQAYDANNLGVGGCTAWLTIKSTSYCGNAKKEYDEFCEYSGSIGCASGQTCDKTCRTCNDCTIECACASAVPIGDTCYDGCVGTVCSGTKVNLDGVCGSSDTKYLTEIPVSGLCTNGTATAVTGDNPWSWTCQGKNGGKDTKCETGKKGSTHYDYVPAYFSDVQYHYCSKKSSIDGVASSDDFLCYGNEFGKPYHYEKTYYGGFREKFNPNDPIIAYQTDELSGEEEKKSYLSFPISMQNKAYDNGMKWNEDIFKGGNALDSRLYFPPGLMGLLLKIQPTQDQGQQTIMGRFGQPPVTDFPPGSSFAEWNVYEQNYTQYPQYFPPEVYSSGNIWNDVMSVNIKYYKKYDILTFQYGGTDHVAIKSFGVDYNGELYYEDIANEGGWLYLKFKDWGKSDPLGYNSGWWAVDAETYTKWYDCMEVKGGWDSKGDPKEDFTACDPSAIQSGPDCAQKTCQGNSCWNDTKWIPGTKTEGCATGEAKADPDRLLNPGNSFITWSSQNASEVEVACNGSFPLARDIWYRSGEECYEDGKYCELKGTEKGYKLTFDEKYFQADQKQEICTFYPTNESDGRPGTPFSFTVNFGEEEDEEEEEEESNPGYTCQPDDPSCAKSTCKDVRCFDGCEYLQGTKDCKGRE